MTQSKGWIGRPGAEREALALLKRAFKRALPESYLRFLAESNGGEGSVLERPFILWPAEEMLHLNHLFEIPENYPGLLGFGSDGLGHAFAFDKRPRGVWPVVVIPFVGVRGEARELAPDFTHFRDLLLGRRKEGPP